MAVSTFDLYKIGIGPSSSHTVGPMRAAARFVENHLAEAGRLQDVARVRAEVFGSLALTGRGHGTDKAVLMGLEGHWPNLIDPDVIPAALERIRSTKQLRLHGTHDIAFDEKTDLVMNKRQKLPFHTNGMRFIAYDANGGEIATRDYYSVGGGFVVNQDEAAEDRIVADTTELAWPFHNGAELLQQCERSGLSIAQLMFANEQAWRGEDAIRAGLRELWSAMQDCVARGIRETGTLPGGLHVSRRAPSLHAELASKPEAALRDPLTLLDWVNLYALAVNEENAAGGRVVTAPTNGAAGIIPAVLHYYDRFCPGANEAGGGHRAGHADFALAADFGAGDRGVFLAQDADGGGSQEEIDHIIIRRVGVELHVVVQHGGNDPGRAIGRRGDHAPTGGVFFVDGEGEQVDPFHGRQR